MSNVINSKTMEKIKKLFSWWRSISPPWIRLVIAVLAVALCFFLSLTSCSSTRAVIRQPKDSSVTRISISTNNPVDVSTNPNIIYDETN